MTSSKLEKHLLKIFGKETAHSATHARYLGGIGQSKRKADEISKLSFLGLTVGMQRAASKEIDRFVGSKKDFELLHQLWIKTKSYDVKSVILFWLGDQLRKKAVIENFKTIFAMANDVDNWALSDNLSMMIASLLEQNPKLFKFHQQWNQSENPWLRRQSIVGIYGYARLRKVQFPATKALALVENLLEDPHFYVQRGVGWTLREIHRVDSALQHAFLEKSLHRISSTAWFAATELYPKRLRDKLVTKRRKYRHAKGAPFSPA